MSAVIPSSIFLQIIDAEGIAVIVGMTDILISSLPAIEINISTVVLCCSVG